MVLCYGHDVNPITGRRYSVVYNVSAKSEHPLLHDQLSIEVGHSKSEVVR